MRFFFSSLVIVGATLLSPIETIHAQAPSIEISLEESLVDQEIIIKLNSLQPHEKIRIQALATDDNGLQWSSFGLFQADDLGEIDLSTQSPIQGSYQKMDSTGLLWSMQTTEPGASFKIKKDRFLVTITAFRGEQEIASRELTRFLKAPNVQKILVQENGLNGILFLPPSKKPLPIVITLTGSSGGFGENRAQALASHGFAVLALAYFGVEGLPPNLQNIPLEYFETAFTWIKNQPAIDGSRVGIYGISRGAELALILGSWFPESVQAIVAVVPSSVVHGGLSTTPVPAWLYHNQQVLPSATKPSMNLSGNEGKDPEHLANASLLFLEGMKDQKSFQAASIPVENITASLLLISGGDDQLWPSTLYATQIQRRLEEKKSPISCQHVNYPKAGHTINLPNLPQPGPAYYHPIGKIWLSMGGTPEEDQHAAQDSWKKLITFFHASLK